MVSDIAQLILPVKSSIQNKNVANFAKKKIEKQKPNIRYRSVVQEYVSSKKMATQPMERFQIYSDSYNEPNLRHSQSLICRKNQP